MNPLEQELLALFSRGMEAELPEAEFNRLALAVFAYQWERNRPYQSYCRARGATPESVADWTQVPAVPTDAFKVADLTTVPPDEVRVTYLTSGTTQSLENRGRHLLPGTTLYDASLEPVFKAHVLPDREQIRVMICGPNSRHFPHSSLGHMNSRVLERWGGPGSGIFWDAEGPKFPCLAAALAKAETEGEPVCLLATAFGLVHFLDYLDREGRTFRLPPGSRIMDTGGYKGRSREVPKAELYSAYGSRLGVPLTHVVNEYGMTELGSQFYDRSLRDSLADPSLDGSQPAARLKVGPPWVRVQVVRPSDLQPVRSGEVGLLRFFDLANLHTVSAIQTDDLGAMREGGFELLGRAAGAEVRGCSLTAEDLP